jgi:hypothetical protein
MTVLSPREGTSTHVIRADGESYAEEPGYYVGTKEGEAPITSS